MNGAVAVVAAVAALACAGCPARTPAPVLDGAWPTAPDDYDTANRTWTRRGTLRGDYQLIAEMHATLKAPPWRAAWIERTARAGRLGADGRARLDAEQRQADQEAWEVTVVLTTWDRRENDLDRGARSVWRLVLIDAAGRELDPIEIRRDRRPANVIRAEFPWYGDFSRAYQVRFPRDGEVLAPGVRRVQLRLSSTRGGIEVAWQSAR
jgi:hypothetical protein